MLLPDMVDLKKLKVEIEITNYELAKRLNIAIATIDDVFSGKTKNPGYLTVKRLFETLAKVARERKKLRSGTNAGEICSKNLKKVKPTETLYRAQKRFENYPGYTTFPVFKEDKLIGLVTETSLRKAIEENSDNWKEFVVKKATITRPHVVDYLTTIDTLKSIIHESYDCVLVTKKDDRKSILGIITNF